MGCYISNEDLLGDALHYPQASHPIALRALEEKYIALVKLQLSISKENKSHLPKVLKYPGI